MKLHYSLALYEGCVCSEYVGDFEVWALAQMESTVKYHADAIFALTWIPESGSEDSVWQVV